MNNYERAAKMMREAVEHPEKEPEKIVGEEKTREEHAEKQKQKTVRQGDVYPHLRESPPKSRLTEWEDTQEEREDRFSSAQKKREEGSKRQMDAENR